MTHARTTPAARIRASPRGRDLRRRGLGLGSGGLLPPSAASCAIVIEQNERPYGKIEDGLPRWHDKLRAKEYERIDAEPEPSRRVLRARDQARARLHARGAPARAGARARCCSRAARGATGRCRSRAPTHTAARASCIRTRSSTGSTTTKSPGYDGPRYEVSDDAIVVGGGLASVDVVKIINIELYRNRAARARHRSLGRRDGAQGHHRPRWQQSASTRRRSACKGARFITGAACATCRWRSPRPDATPEQITKTEGVREKMVGILTTSSACACATARCRSRRSSEDGRMVGMRVPPQRSARGQVGRDRRQRARGALGADRQLDRQRARSRSRASRTRGELYDYASWDTGALRGLAGVFGLGNVLTGKGNIRDSRDNAEEISHAGAARLPRPDRARARARRGNRRVHGARSRGRACVGRAEAIESAIRRAKVPAERLSQDREAIEQRWARERLRRRLRHVDAAGTG